MSRPTRWTAALAIVAAALLAAPARAEFKQFYGPTHYQSFADSPFKSLPFYYFYLENFENDTLGTPGVTVSRSSIMGPSLNTDSVDGDDGVLDGWCPTGHSLWWSSGISGIFFTFDDVKLGQLPTNVGIVWTDGRDYIHFEAFDRNHVSLGYVDGVSADGQFSSSSDEDRFYGIVYSGGVKSFEIQSGLPSAGGLIEVDHLQYGVQVGLVGVGDGGRSTLALEAARPNPFHGDCAIGYSLPAPGKVQLTVIDASGRLVRRLVDGLREAGPHVERWDGANGTGSAVPAGIYFVRLGFGEQLVTRKIVRIP